MKSRLALSLLIFLLCVPVVSAGDRMGKPVVGRGPVLVASVVEGGFTDLGPVYQAAFDALGRPADLVHDPDGDWPDLRVYDLVLVTFSDNYLGSTWSPADEEILAAYLDQGGKLVVVGQDYLWFRGTHVGFPQDYLGVCGHVDDPGSGDSLTWEGSPGGPLDGLAGDVDSCFPTSPLYADEIDPCTRGGNVKWGPAWPPPIEGGSVLGQAIFSTVEFGCSSDLPTILDHWIDFLERTCPGYDPLKWNGFGAPNYQAMNNCYNYATNRKTYTVAQPGRGGGSEWQNPLTNTEIVQAALLDGLWSPSPAETCTTGCRVALLVHEECDFHWLREGWDGTWSHKMGPGPVSNRDTNNDVITDPMTAVICSEAGCTGGCQYQFVQYFCVTSAATIMKAATKAPSASRDEIFFEHWLYFGRPNPRVVLTDPETIAELRARLDGLPPAADPGWWDSGPATPFHVSLPEFAGYPILVHDGVVGFYFESEPPSFGLDLHDLEGWLQNQVTAVGDPASSPPRAPEIRDVYPNPFNPNTRIEFTLPSRLHARITVHDLRGQQLAVLFDQQTEGGPRATVWNGRDSRGRGLPSGPYLIRLEAGGQVAHRRVTMIR